MTAFTHKHAGDNLRDAAELINNSMDWESTPEGHDHWVDIYLKLLERAIEHKSNVGGLSCNTTGNGNGITIVMDNGRKEKLELLPVGYGTQSGPIETTHVWHAGSALCGLPGQPWEWPVGHVRVGLSDYLQATCSVCSEKASKIVRP